MSLLSQASGPSILNLLPRTDNQGLEWPGLGPWYRLLFMFGGSGKRTF